MYLHHLCFVLVAVIGSTLSFPGEYIPRSYYLLHNNGERSPTVFLREKRSLEETLAPLLRMRRGCDGGCGDGGNGNGGGNSGSFSSSSSYAGSGSGSGGIYFPDHFKAGFDAAAKLAGFPSGFPGNFADGAGFPGGAGGFGGCDSCGGHGGDAGHGSGGVDLSSRFGGDDGISYSGSAKGAKGVYSASSSSIDSDGNVKYSVKTGKY